MSERGVFAIDRGLFGHERFAPEPFTEREAWIWMIGEAAFKPYGKRVGSIRVELRRGQLAHSLRFMAERWKWTESRVRRFLAKLKAPDALIDAATDRGLTVVTICKYDVYQDIVRRGDAPTDALIDAATTQRRIFGKAEEGSGGGARAREEFALTLQIGVIAGYPDATYWPPGWIDAPRRIRTMLDAGWNPEIMILAAKQAMARKTDGPPYSINFFERPFARAHARAAAPLPQLPLLQAIDGGKNETDRPDHRTGWQRDRDAFRGAVEKLEASVAADGGG